MSLDRLPTELLFEVADWLTIPDLRILGLVNKQYASFVNGYCKTYQYKLGLFRLPHSVLKQLMVYLDTMKEQSRFARISIKLYPVVMTSLVSTATAADKSALLNHASRRDNVLLARKVVRLGGDVNQQQNTWDLPLLLNAVRFGHAAMARFLLQAGANPLDERGIPALLQRALKLGHDEVTLFLCEGLSQKDTINRSAWGESILHEACSSGRSVVVEGLLARGHSGQTLEESTRFRSQILHAYLRTHAWEGSLIIDRKLVAKPPRRSLQHHQATSRTWRRSRYEVQVLGTIDASQRVFLPEVG